MNMKKITGKEYNNLKYAWVKNHGGADEIFTSPMSNNIYTKEYFCGKHILYERVETYKTIILECTINETGEKINIERQCTYLEMWMDDEKETYTSYEIYG